jgi:hypothetical protein
VETMARNPSYLNRTPTRRPTESRQAAAALVEKGPHPGGEAIPIRCDQEARGDGDEGRSRLGPSEAARRLLTETRRADRGLRWGELRSLRPLRSDPQSRLRDVAEAAAQPGDDEGVVELAKSVGCQAHR